MTPVVAYCAPFAVAATVWFLSTALVFRLDSLPKRTHAWSLSAATLLALGAVIEVRESAARVDATGAYIGFAAALAIWGWHELSFLTGVITGPNRAALPADTRGFARFRAGAGTLIHHEIALALTIVGLFALTWHRANQTAPLTFALLFAMRLSAKLNLFAGVPHFASELLPPRLAYLKSYFRRSPATPMLAAALVMIAYAAIGFAMRAYAAPPGSGAETGAALCFALAGLGLIEHLFLVLPLKDSALWMWAASKAAAPALQPITAPAHAGGTSRTS